MSGDRGTTGHVVIAQALGVITAALEARTHTDAVKAARAAAEQLEADVARRVAGYLAVRLVSGRVPTRSRSATRAWVQSEWVKVMQSPPQPPAPRPAGELEKGRGDDGV